MASYLASHVREFRIKAIQGLIVAIHDRVEDEITNAALYARQAEERRIQQEEAHNRMVADFQQAARNHAQLQAEVDEWQAQQAQQSRSAVERAWEANEEEQEELNANRTTPLQRPQQSSRGRRGRQS